MCVQVMHAEQKNVYAFPTEYQEHASLATSQAAIVPPKCNLI